jgi:hypothetical protein
MVGHECNWQDGVLSLNGPRHAATGTLKFGDIEIGRDFNDGPELLVINNCTLKITNLPVFADNVAALAGGLPEHALYTTSSGELRVVRD